MADCSKTVDFLRELTRMCGSFELCSLGCPLRDPDGSMCGFDPESCSDKTIDIVQKWSDEHPVITWLDMLIKSLPNAQTVDLVAKTCPGWMFGTGPDMYKTKCTGKQEYRCGACWLSDYKEAEK